MEDCHQLAVLLPPSLDSFGGQSDPVLHRLGVATGKGNCSGGGLSKRLQLVICKMEGKWGLGQGHELRGELAVCSGLPAQNCCSKHDPSLLDGDSGQVLLTSEYSVEVKGWHPEWTDAP